MISVVCPPERPFLASAAVYARRASNDAANSPELAAIPDGTAADAANGLIFGGEWGYNTHRPNTLLGSSPVSCPAVGRPVVFIFLRGICRYGWIPR